MRIVSWNVNGVRAAVGKGLVDWLLEHEPDVLLLQETKARPDEVPAQLAALDGWSWRLHAAKRRGYSGVGIWTRREPDEWIEGLGDAAFDDEGRWLGARFGDLVVCTAYFPNSQAEGARLDYRLAFGDAALAALAAHRRRGRHVVVGGDFNVAHEPIDLARPKQNERNPGYLPEERAWMTRFLAAGYVDSWRRLHPDQADAYTWWSFRFAARSKNIGWRLDYLCVDEALWPAVRGAEILAEVEGSDHCPVALELDRVAAAR